MCVDMVVLSRTRWTGTWLAKIYTYDAVFVQVSVSGNVCRHHGMVLSGRTRRTGACLAKIYACAAVLMQVSVSMRADKYHFEQPAAQSERTDLNKEGIWLKRSHL